MPENIKKNLTVIEAIIRPEIKGYCLDFLKEVISIVACHVRKGKKAAPLKMNYIKRLVPQGDKYLKALIDLDIIERTGYYIPGQVSYKYSFTPLYDSKYTGSMLTNAKLIRRTEAVHQVFTDHAAKSVRGHSEQVRFLKMLTIDPGYMTFINENYTANTDAFNRVLASATRIFNNDIRYKRDSTSGRFHSNVTNCPKGFRPYLRVNGEPLVNIDVKNCQPYLSTIILTDPGKASAFTENAAFAMLLQTLKVSHKEDVKNYIKLVINGQLYEYLMQEYDREGLHLDRAETKRQVLRILFARNRSPKDETNRKARQIFKSRFPMVHKIFSKVRGHDKGDRFSNYSRFAILLQRIESHLILDVVLKRIYRELPGVVAITIHDSIMTGVLTNDVEAVKNILIEDLTKFVGFRPQVSLEIYNEREGRKGEESREEEIREWERELKKQYDATTFIKVN